MTHDQLMSELNTLKETVEEIGRLLDSVIDPMVGGSKPLRKTYQQFLEDEQKRPGYSSGESLRSYFSYRRALEFAIRHHAGQVRKYTGEPYIYHPIAVAEIVTSVGHTDEMVAAALLHDVVEDTDATLDDVEREFGPEVAALVEMVTDVSRPEDGNRAARKAIDRDHLAKASYEAKTIKLADLIHNTQSIGIHDPKFARTYLAEKRALLEVLGDGDFVLFQQASEIAGHFEARLDAED